MHGMDPSNIRRRVLARAVPVVVSLGFGGSLARCARVAGVGGGRLGRPSGTVTPANTEALHTTRPDRTAYPLPVTTARTAMLRAAP
jgi:hypothetical protein